jgi:phosphoribosylformimino-5-aminoimidazole carboxamide ribotide isomerase
MDIYPAIDLMHGRCVRLTGGDFDAPTFYDDDPFTMARTFQDAGVEWLHVVDLDGARNPKNRQFRTIAALAAETSLKIQTGGGVRTGHDVNELISLGASRIIIGSLCVSDPELTKTLLKKFGEEKIVLALDVRGDFEKGFFVATGGWIDDSGEKVETLLERYEGLVRHVLCTDISRDGKLEGPNSKLYKYLHERTPSIRFQASGGVAQLSDLGDLKDSGASAAIIGKALYEKKFSINDALRTVA